MATQQASFSIAHQLPSFSPFETVDEEWDRHQRFRRGRIVTGQACRRAPLTVNVGMAQRRRPRTGAAQRQCKRTPFDERLPPGGHVVTYPRATPHVPQLAVRNSTLLVGTVRRPASSPASPTSRDASRRAGQLYRGRPLVRHAHPRTTAMTTSAPMWIVTAAEEQPPQQRAQTANATTFAGSDVRWLGSGVGWQRARKLPLRKSPQRYGSPARANISAGFHASAWADEQVSQLSQLMSQVEMGIQ